MSAEDSLSQMALESSFAAAASLFCIYAIFFLLPVLIICCVVGKFEKRRRLHFTLENLVDIVHSQDLPETIIDYLQELDSDL